MAFLQSGSALGCCCLSASSATWSPLGMGHTERARRPREQPHEVLHAVRPESSKCFHAHAVAVSRSSGSTSFSAGSAATLVDRVRPSTTLEP